ncbi:hypothetical protein [Alistipes putredinis]|uniref:hypothetical protein n=1 Tax=Alistipes putredinis TaxID=28117 RepID=UPI003A90A0FB
MKRILLFITATLLLASGTSCSDDNTNFDPIGDELGIPYKDGHDVYGVEVWTPEEVSFTDYYSLIDSTIHEKNTTKSIWWFSPVGIDCSIHWNSSAPIIAKSYSYEPFKGENGGSLNMNHSRITIDLTDATNSFTVETIITIGDQSIRRFQTIPIQKKEWRCDAFFYTFGATIEQMKEWIDFDNSLNTNTLKAALLPQYFTPPDFFGYSELPDQKLVKLYCTATEINSSSRDLLEDACNMCQIPEEPKFELQSGTENIYRVLNPQQWEINGLRCTLENTTWRQLGASDDTDDTEFACLTIEKI